MKVRAKEKFLSRFVHPQKNRKFDDRDRCNFAYDHMRKPRMIYTIFFKPKKSLIFSLQSTHFVLMEFF
jgi:hypothetical protein